MVSVEPKAKANNQPRINQFKRKRTNSPLVNRRKLHPSKNLNRSVPASPTGSNKDTETVKGSKGDNRPGGARAGTKNKLRAANRSIRYIHLVAVVSKRRSKAVTADAISVRPRNQTNEALSLAQLPLDLGESFVLSR